MDQRITWSLIIAGVIVIAGAAIWGLWYLLKENQGPEMKKKLKKELNEIVENASVNALDAFISQKSKAFIEDTAALGQVKTDAVITLTDTELAARKAALLTTYTSTDNAKINSVVVTAASDCLTTAQKKIDAAIEKEAKEIIKNLISKKIKDKASSLCEKEAKSATDKDVYNLVEHGSNDENTAKDKIKEKAQQEAMKKVEAIINNDQWLIIKTAVQTEGKEALKKNLTEIIKKNDLIDETILTIANVPKKS
uniref:Crp32B n=1 Tax=Cotesia chilonis TaxID=89804 RepID=A0A411G5V2_9HYME|nr:Crp32B [Cotesia chilonis]